MYLETYDIVHHKLTRYPTFYFYFFSQMFEFIINEMIFKKKEEKERKKERKKNTVKYPIIASLRIFLALKT